MDALLDPFKAAWKEGNGYALADTLTPIEPASDPQRLLRFWTSTNYHSFERDIGAHIFYGNSFSKDEGKGWVEVYAAFWEAVGEILIIEDQVSGRSSVSQSRLVFTRQPYLTLRYGHTEDERN